MPRRSSVETLAKERKALALKQAGHTFEAIAERVGYRDRSGARKAYERALERAVPDDGVREARKLELSRLDAITQVLWPKVLNGDVAAIDRYAKISEMRRRLGGLDLEYAPAAEPASEGAKDGEGETDNPVADLEARRAARQSGA